MEKVIKQIEEKYRDLIKCFKKCHSKSRYYQLYEELVILDDIYFSLTSKELPDINDFVCQSYENDLSLIYRRFNKKAKKDLEENYDYYKKISTLAKLKEYCPIYYEADNRSDIILLDNYISDERTIGLAINFLDSYNPKITDSFIRVVINNRAIICPANSHLPIKIAGTTYLLNDSKENYLILERTNNLSDSFTLVHETGHIYTYETLANVPTHKLNNLLYDNIFLEVFSYYLELLYNDYLRKTKEGPKFSQDLWIISRDFDFNLLLNLSALKKLFTITEDDSRNTLYDNLEESRNTLTNAISQIIAYHFYDMYQIDPEKAKFNTERFVIDSAYYDKFDLLKRCDINPENLTNPDILKRYLIKHFN